MYHGNFARNALRAVALLGDQQLCYTAQVLTVGLVDFLAEDEGNQAGVLLDGTGLARRLVA